MTTLTRPEKSIAIGGTVWGYDPANTEQCYAVNVTNKGTLETEDRNISSAASGFSGITTVQRTPLIEINSKYGFSLLRDRDRSTNGGSISTADGEFVLSSGTSANATADIISTEVGRYMPGYSCEIGIGMRCPTQPTGTQNIQWGGESTNSQNQLLFGYDSGGMFVELIRNGSSSKVYQSSWNIDKMDGNGNSSYNLDTSIGHIYQITYTWYGYGQVVWSIIATIDGKQRNVPVHQMSGFTTTSIRDPNLRIGSRVQNNSETTDLTAYMGGRQFSVIGRYSPKYRFVSDYRRAVATNTSTFTPLVSFRLDPSKLDRATAVEVDAIEVTATTGDHLIELVYNGELTGASWGVPTDHTDDEVLTQSDVSATSVDTSNGVVFHQELILESDKKGQEFSRSTFRLALPVDGTFTVVAKSFDVPGEVTAIVRMREEW